MTEEISLGDEMFECIMVGLRKIKGIDRAEFAQRFGIDPVEHYASAMLSLRGIWKLRMIQCGLHSADWIFKMKCF